MYQVLWWYDDVYLVSFSVEALLVRIYYGPHIHHQTNLNEWNNCWSRIMKIFWRDERMHPYPCWFNELAPTIPVLTCFWWRRERIYFLCVQIIGRQLFHLFYLISSRNQLLRGLRHISLFLCALHMWHFANLLFDVIPYEFKAMYIYDHIHPTYEGNS